MYTTEQKMAYRANTPQPCTSRSAKGARHAGSVNRVGLAAGGLAYTSQGVHDEFFLFRRKARFFNEYLFFC
jgi:hypothetical protein